MADSPYTDEQVRMIGVALQVSPRDTPESVGSIALQRLRLAGIEVTFPDPPPYRVLRVTPGKGGGEPYYQVALCADDDAPEVPVANFYSAQADKYAREHADRLNGEWSR